MSNSGLVVCLSTVADLEQARSLASSMIRERLAACVQIDGPIESHYQWEGKTCREQEYRLVIKTTSAKGDQLKQRLMVLHPYDQPQIVLLPCSDSDSGYADWVRQQTT